MQSADAEVTAAAVEVLVATCLCDQVDTAGRAIQVSVACAAIFERTAMVHGGGGWCQGRDGEVGRANIQRE